MLILGLFNKGKLSLHTCSESTCVNRKMRKLCRLPAKVLKLIFMASTIVPCELRCLSRSHYSATMCTWVSLNSAPRSPEAHVSTHVPTFPCATHRVARGFLPPGTMAEIRLAGAASKYHPAASKSHEWPLIGLQAGYGPPKLGSA